MKVEGLCVRKLWVGNQVGRDVVGMLWKCCGNAVGMSMLTVYETYNQPCIGPPWWCAPLWHTGSSRDSVKPLSGMVVGVVSGWVCGLRGDVV